MEVEKKLTSIFYFKKYLEEIIMRKLTNEEVQSRLADLRKNGCDVFTTDIYKRSCDDMDFYCSKGHHWPAKLSNIFLGKGCPYCANRKVWVGYNDLWTTNPEIAMLLENKDAGYLYTKGSEHKENFICQDCGAILNKVINNVRRRGLSCDVCGDGISYPNKFARALLKQLNVTNVKYEWQPDWLKPYFYDTYFEYNGQKYVLEMDGGLGHGNKSYGSNKGDIIGAERDGIKDLLSVQHNVIVIRIDCDYTDIVSRFDFIKNSILYSELSLVCSLCSVDWTRCDAEAVSSFIYKVAKMYNIGVSMSDMAREFNYNINTIRGWLKTATQIGLCSYSSSEAKSRACKTKKMVNQYSTDSCYLNTYASYREAYRQTGIDSSSIRKCCKHIKKSAGGYIWFDADDPTQPDPTKIIPNKMIKEE